MLQRKEITNRIIKDDGEAISYRILDSITVDDQMLMFMHNSLFKVATSQTRDIYFGRKEKDFLIKLYTLYS